MQTNCILSFCSESINVLRARSKQSALSLLFCDCERNEECPDGEDLTTLCSQLPDNDTSFGLWCISLALLFGLEGKRDETFVEWR